MVDRPPATVIETFLRRIFGAVPHDNYVAVWSLPSKASRFIPVGDARYAAELCVTLDGKSEDVYFGVCPHAVKPHKGRGKKETVSCVPALWLDFDLRHDGAHKAEAAMLPATADEVLDLLDTIPELPAASIIVHSGYGLHIYWVLTTPVASDVGARMVKQLQRVVQHAATAKGYHLDSTHDIARVLRVPATHNRKVLGASPVVEVLYDGDDTIDAGAFAALATLADTLGETVDSASTVGAGTTAGSGDPAVVPRDVDRAITLDEVRKALGKVKNDRSKALITKLLKGESIAPKGKRDATMQSVAQTVGNIAPDNDAVELAELFRPTLTEWAAEDGAKLTLEQELDKAIDKIDRAQALKRKERAIAEREAEEWRATSIAEARQAGAPPGSAVNNEPYNDLELRRWADEYGIDSFDRRWIIQKGDSFYVFVDGEYRAPIKSQELLASVVRDLAPAPVSLIKTTGKTSRAKSPTELVSEYGQVARVVVAEMGLDKSYYDAREQTFHEAIARLRPVVPQYHEHIDGWLRALGGVHAEKLLDWLATVTDLTRPSSVLYITGKKSAGKSMLAQGIARLWIDGGPSMLENVIAHFNDDLTRCPLVWADESLPQDWGKKSATAKLREISTADTRTLNRKHLPSAQCKGCVRVILTANSERMVSLGDEDASEADVEALAARFLHIDVGTIVSPAADYLSALGGRNGTEGKAGTEGWVDADMIAAHIMWLRDNRQVNKGDRFVVEGDAGEMSKRLAYNSSYGEAALEWLARYLASDNSSAPGVIVGNGAILVNAQDMVNAWDLHMETVRTPTVARLTRVLKPFVEGEVRPRGEGARKRYHRVKVDVVMYFAEQMQIGDVDAMLARINGDAKGAAA